MQDKAFREFLEEIGQFTSKSIVSRVAKANAAERILGCSLDIIVSNDDKMYDALIEGTKGKTVIYISHRLSSATRSDNILVFNKGVLEEQGNHEKLMADKGYYQEMFTLQASGYKEVFEDE